MHTASPFSLPFVVFQSLFLGVSIWPGYFWLPTGGRKERRKEGRMIGKSDGAARQAGKAATYYSTGSGTSSTPPPPFHPSTPRVRVSDSSLMKGWRRRAGEEKRHKKATSNQTMTEKFALSISFPPSTRYRRPCPCKHRNYGPPGISPDTRNVMDARGDRERKRFCYYLSLLPS